MVYLCRDCGHDESFDAIQNVTEYCTESVTLNGDGEVIDWGDRDTNDSEVTDGPDNIECGECNSSNVEEYDTQEEMEIAQEEDRIEREDIETGTISPTATISNSDGVVNWKETYLRRRKE